MNPLSTLITKFNTINYIKDKKILNKTMISYKIVYLHF